MLLRSGKQTDSNMSVQSQSQSHSQSQNKYIPKTRDDWVYEHTCKDCTNNTHKVVKDFIQESIKKGHCPHIQNIRLRVNQRRVYKGLVQILKYNLHMIEDVTWLFSSIDDNKIFCTNCYSKFINDKSNINYAILRRMLLRSCITTNMFELMISEEYKKLMNNLLQNNPKFLKVVKNKLKEFRNECINTPTNYDWKGADYYYKKLFNISSVLDGIVSIEHYNYRKNTYFDDVICGHPKASHGWFAESLEELYEMGVFQ